MASSDIYEVKESPWKQETQPTSQRTKRRRNKSFEDTVNEDLSRTHRRRRRNSGFRRFRHQMKKPGYSKRFWIIVLSIFGTALLVLILWDLFFRYPKPKPDYSRDLFEAVGE